MNRLSIEMRAQVVTALVEGNSIRSTCRMTGVAKGTVLSLKLARPDPAHISTSYVERSNLSMRISMRRFTRLTNGFSKKIENHRHMLAIYYMYYNYVRRHATLRVSLAMEAGLSDHLWTVEDLVRLMEPKSILDGLAQTA
jgi:hypothetical protein